MAAEVTTKTRHVSDLVQLGFYFYLRSCEDTKYTGHLRKLQLWPLLDFIFCVGDRLLPDNSPIENLQHVPQIVLTLDNQKNAIRG